MSGSMSSVSTSGRSEPRRHLSVVPDDTQPALWDSRDLHRLAQLRQLALDTGAPQDALRLIDTATNADDAVGQLLRAGLMPDEDESYAEMLAWFTPLLEPGCDQVEAEVCGAEFIGELRRTAPPEAELADILADVVARLPDHPCPEALAMARVLAAVGLPEVRPLAADSGARLVAAGQRELPWAAGLGAPRPGPCFGYADIYGEQRSVVVSFSYGRKRHAMVVFIDYVLGGGVRHCYLTSYNSRLRDDYLALGAQPGFRFKDLTGGTARQLLQDALACEPCPSQQDQAEDLDNYLDLLRARVDLLPEARSATGQRAKRASRTPGSTGDTVRRQQVPRNIHRLKITLRGTRPAIWRRIEVPSDITLSRLHAAIQAAFGWEDSHLWAFETPDARYGIRDADLDIRSAAGRKLSAVADWPGDRFRYEYDFGDSWEHDIVVEAVQPAESGVAYPRCTGGRRACPPEDSGGVWGYSELLNVLANPRHEDHRQMLSWLGLESAADFDPDRFDPAVASRYLARLAKVLVRP